MTTKLQLDRLSWEVGECLITYVTIHNDLFKTSIRRVIPLPFIFQRINYKKHIDSIEYILTRLQEHYTKTNLLLNDENETNYQEYLNLLTRYISALTDTIIKFKLVVSALYAKSQSFTNSNFDWKNYKKDLDSYEQSIPRYSELGMNLTNLFRQLK